MKYNIVVHHNIILHASSLVSPRLSPRANEKSNGKLHGGSLGSNVAPCCWASITANVLWDHKTIAESFQRPLPLRPAASNVIVAFQAMTRPLLIAVAP